MFTLDPRHRGLPATRDQVVALHQSINTPHVAIPGKQAGPAQAFIVGLRSGAAVGVYVYLYLAEAADCAVYVSGRRSVSPDAYGGEEAEALAFVESLGFMMDNANFRALPAPRQEELVRTLPVFQKDPRQAPAAAGARSREEEKRSAATHLGRLLAAF